MNNYVHACAAIARILAGKDDRAAVAFCAETLPDKVAALKHRNEVQAREIERLRRQVEGDVRRGWAEADERDEGAR